MELQNLMELPGAIAAFSFTDRGELTGQVIREGTEITTQVLELVARSSVANVAVASMEAMGWEAVTGQGGFQPLQGFSAIGLEWSVVVRGNRGVIAKNRDIDYEASFAALA